MSERAAGSIYDLGYRRYSGVRLGRRHAVVALYVHGLRAAFGLGRRTRSKIFPIALAIIAAIPAIVQIAIASIVNTDDLDVFEAEEYYSYVQVVLALFAAAVAPELLGRDQRHQTLSLYFSRALSRYDYALARFAAMATALLALTLLPQALLFFGNALAVDEFGGYFRQEWDQIGPIILSGLLVSLFIAGIAMIIAAQTPRRAFATIGIVVPFILLAPIAALLVETLDGARAGIFVSPFHVMNGFTFWFFNATPDAEGNLAQADFHGSLYAIVALAVTAIGVALLLRRYERLSS